MAVSDSIDKLKWRNKIIMLILTVLYLGIPVIYAFHKDVHPEMMDSQTSLFKKINAGHQCGICHYVLHKHGKYTVNFTRVTVRYFEPAPYILRNLLTCKIPPSFLPGFTNRGPPVPASLSIR